MKKSIYILTLILIPLVLFGQKEKQKAKFFIQSAVQIAAKENKILIIEFWAPSCGPCVKLKRDIFDNDKNKEFLNKYFVIKKVSPADSLYNTLFRYFNCIYQSTVVFIDKKGNEIDRTVAYEI